MPSCWACAPNSSASILTRLAGRALCAVAALRLTVGAGPAPAWRVAGGSQDHQQRLNAVPLMSTCKLRKAHLPRHPPLPALHPRTPSLEAGRARDLVIGSRRAQLAGGAVGTRLRSWGALLAGGCSSQGGRAIGAGIASGSSQQLSKGACRALLGHGVGAALARVAS